MLPGDSGVGWQDSRCSGRGWAADGLRRRHRGCARHCAEPDCLGGVCRGMHAGCRAARVDHRRRVYRLVDGRACPVRLAPGLLRVADGAAPCRVVSAGHVVETVPSLDGPVAADMESAALAEVAGAAGLPFLVLRLVTDTPARPLPRIGRNLAAALAAHGGADRTVHSIRAVFDAVRRPVSAVAFLRDTALWRDRLRDGWHERRDGVCLPRRSSVVSRAREARSPTGVRRGPEPRGEAVTSTMSAGNQGPSTAKRECRRELPCAGRATHRRMLQKQCGKSLQATTNRRSIPFSFRKFGVTTAVGYDERVEHEHPDTQLPPAPPRPIRLLGTRQVDRARRRCSQSETAPSATSARAIPAKISLSFRPPMPNHARSSR